MKELIRAIQLEATFYMYDHNAKKQRGFAASNVRQMSRTEWFKNFVSAT